LKETRRHALDYQAVTHGTPLTSAAGLLIAPSFESVNATPALMPSFASLPWTDTSTP
jgi:hypothetical protein